MQPDHTDTHLLHSLTTLYKFLFKILFSVFNFLAMATAIQYPDCKIGSFEWYRSDRYYFSVHHQNKGIFHVAITGYNGYGLGWLTDHDKNIINVGVYNKICHGGSTVKDYILHEDFFVSIRQGVESFLGMDEKYNFMILFVIHNNDTSKSRTIYKAELPFNSKGGPDQYPPIKNIAEAIKWQMADYVISLQQCYPLVLKCEGKDITIRGEDIIEKDGIKDNFSIYNDVFYENNNNLLYALGNVSGTAISRVKIQEYAMGGLLQQENKGKIVAKPVGVSTPLIWANINSSHYNINAVLCPSI